MKIGWWSLAAEEGKGTGESNDNENKKTNFLYTTQRQTE
jgi:hypothetical protein